MVSNNFYILSVYTFLHPCLALGKGKLNQFDRECFNHQKDKSTSLFFTGKESTRHASGFSQVLPGGLVLQAWQPFKVTQQWPSSSAINSHLAPLEDSLQRVLSRFVLWFNGEQQQQQQQQNHDMSYTKQLKFVTNRISSSVTPWRDLGSASLEWWQPGYLTIQEIINMTLGLSHVTSHMFSRVFIAYFHGDIGTVSIYLEQSYFHVM